MSEICTSYSLSLVVYFKVYSCLDNSFNLYIDYFYIGLIENESFIAYI